MAASFFSEGFFQQVGLHAQVRKHALQLAVVILQALHLADHRRIHAVKLRPPLIEGRCAHAVFLAKLSNRHAAFLPQYREDLWLAKFRHLHQNLLSHLAKKILRPQPLSFGKDYRMTACAPRLGIAS